jgi:hypothetical protein
MIIQPAAKPCVERPVISAPMLWAHIVEQATKSRQRQQADHPTQILESFAHTAVAATLDNSHVDPTHVQSVAGYSMLTVVGVAVVDIEKSSAARKKESSRWDYNSVKTLLYIS